MSAIRPEADTHGRAATGIGPLRTLALLLRSRNRWGRCMHDHLPKPLHGWRVFAGEVGIIVLGVLIALGAQQTVEAIRWREEVRLTEETLTNEIALSIVNAAERKMVDQCLRNRLAHLIAKIRSEEAQWRADPMQLASKDNLSMGGPAPYRTPWRTWDQSAWASAKSSGVLSRMPREQVAALSGLYAAFDSERQAEAREEAAFSELLYLSFDTTLDAQARRYAMSVLGQLDWLNGTIVITADQLIDDARTMHLDFSRTNLHQNIADVERGQREFRGSCVKHVDIRL